MKNHYNKPYSTIISLILIISAYLAYFSINFYKFTHTPLLPPGKTLNYILPQHASIRILAHDLQQQGILQHPNYLIVLGYLNGTAEHLQAGNIYSIPEFYQDNY